MKIKKLKINGYDVYLYPTKKYATMHMRFLFETPYTRKSLFLGDLLEEYMMCSNKKYKTRKDISERCMELYSASVSIHYFHVGVKMFTEAIFNFFDPELVNDDYLKEALEYARDIIFYPNFENGKLDADELKRCRDVLIASIGNSLLDYHYKESCSFTKSMYPDSHQTVAILDSKEDYIDLINSFTDQDFIDLHDEIFQNSVVGLILVGNFTDKHLKYIEELFKFKTVKELDEDYKEKLKISTKTPFFVKTSDPQCEESILRVVYSCPGHGLKRRLIYSVIARMLGSSGMIQHKVLRDELGIVYSTDVTYDRHQNIMVLRAFINKENLEKAQYGLDDSLRRLDSRELVQDLLDKIKEESELFLYTFDENKRNPIHEVFDLAFKFDVSKNKKQKILNSIIVDDILNALQDMKKMKVHFYEGVKK